MAFLITYAKSNALLQLEWIAPTGWSEQTIRADFLRRFPGAQLISIEAQV